MDYVIVKRNPGGNDEPMALLEGELLTPVDQKWDWIVDAVRSAHGASIEEKVKRLIVPSSRYYLIEVPDEE